MGKQWRQWQTLFSWAPESLDGDCSREIESCLLLGRKAMTNLDNVLKKQRHRFADTGLCSQSYVFSSSHLWMWRLDHKEGWAPRNWCFQAVILEPPKTKSVTVSIVSPSIYHELMGSDAMILVFWMLSFKPTTTLSFTFNKRLFCSYSLSAIRVVLS